MVTGCAIGKAFMRRIGPVGRRSTLAAMAGLLAAGPLRAVDDAFPPDLSRKIDFVVVLYTENRSFDNLYGRFPGANGLGQAKPEQVRQTDAMGRPLACLPQAYLSDSTTPDVRFPPAATKDRFGHGIADLLAPPPRQGFLANRYYDADRFAALDSVSGDLVHRFYTEQYQINRVADPKNDGGYPMGKFVNWSNNPGLVMGVYDVQGFGEARLAADYVLCDNTFHSAFGGSFLNHFWLVSARSPLWPNFSAGEGVARVGRTLFDANGFPALQGSTLVDAPLTNDPKLTGFPRSNASKALGPDDYWAVNTLQPANGPAQDAPETRLPLQDFDNIGDRLAAAGVTWAWFGGGWNDAKAGRPDRLFQYHHQPFAYFRRFALSRAPVNATAGRGSSPGADSEASARFLKDEDDFDAALAAGTLPHVSFVKPLGESSGHPGQSSVVSEQEWVGEMVARIRKSPCWSKVAIFVIPDENGGLWDHVPPPLIDCWGPGTRVPMIIISPHARKGFVDHTQYETVSILKFIELRWNLPALNARDAAAAAPLNAFLSN
jgi:acid phosphatase